MPSAALHPAVIDQYLFTELQKGHVAGPYAISPIPNLHVSFFGVTQRSTNMESGSLSWTYLAQWAIASTMAFLGSLALYST